MMTQIDRQLFSVQLSYVNEKNAFSIIAHQGKNLETFTINKTLKLTSNSASNSVSH